MLKQYFQHVKPTDAPLNTWSLNKYIRRKLYSVADKVFAVAPEEYNYNNSFSFLDGFTYSYPIQFNYQYCNICIEDNPYRIWASLKDDNESTVDKFRQIRPNDYTDSVGGETGPITDLFVNFSKLYATTNKSLFNIPVRPQSLQTDVSSIFLGTGEVLSIPPIQLKNSNFAFGGQQSFTSRLTTEYGTFYVDGLASIPILLGTQIEDLSMSGQRHFWQEKGELEFLKQFEQITGEKFPYISHTSPEGVGYKSTYDPRFKRLLIHKRDFNILPTWAERFEYLPNETDNPLEYTTPNKLWFNGHSFYHNDKSGNQTKVTFEDIQFFENKSFTLSYSFITRNWVSFHSYLPSFMFNNSDVFLSQNQYSDIFKHVYNNKQVFYDTKFPYIIDVILSNSPMNAKTTTSITFTAQTYEFDNNTYSTKPVNKTFDSVIIYNTTQSSGELKLTIPEAFELPSSLGVSLIKQTDKQYRLNGFRDLTISHMSPI